MRAVTIFIFGALFLLHFPVHWGKAQSKQDQADTSGFVLPGIEEFHHNKIPTTNAINPEPAIFSMVNITASQLVTASISLEEQSVVIAPFQLKSYKLNTFDMAVKVGLKDNISYLGTGFKWKPRNARMDAIYNKVAKKYQALHQNIVGMSNEQVKATEMKKFISIYRNALIEDIYQEFNRSQITLQGSASALLFEIIGGDKVDVDGNGFIDNFHHIKGFNLSGGASFSFSQKAGLHVNYNYSERRANPAENTASAVYSGFSATLSKLFIINKKYIGSDDYLKHSFIPGLEIALAYEYEEVINNENFAENGILSQTSIAPVFDLKISPLSQIRLSLPLKMIDLPNRKEQRLTALVQYNLQISDFQR
ncbi:hypothetical protein QQ020_11555 [Fulvivirgaceae bacterium BMA12]|uniref:Uncharacterized protein n=1 Tax=Agaribacillus aureus TaxID=3051825 RepID=A0ABT8L4N4_9BACT|nr:hypothetical protein [Fulvivirgaceae bacterium BMA12]